VLTVGKKHDGDGTDRFLRGFSCLIYHPCLLPKFSLRSRRARPQKWSISGETKDGETSIHAQNLAASATRAAAKVSLDHSGPANSLMVPKGNPPLRLRWFPKNLAIGDRPRHEHWQE